MPGFRPKQFESKDGDLLREKQITTIDELWAAVGEDFHSGLATVAQSTTVTELKLLEVLVDQEPTVIDRAIPSTQDGIEFWLRDIVLVRKRIRRFLKEHAPELIVLLVLAFAGILAVRAMRAERRAIVTTRSIEAGRVISADDFTTAPLTPAGAYFDVAHPPTGLIASEPIGRGQLLKHSSLSRLQLTALKDIPVGAELTNDSVAPGWSRYSADALVQQVSAVGKRALRQVKAGEVISAQDVVP